MRSFGRLLYSMVSFYCSYCTLILLSEQFKAYDCKDKEYEHLVTASNG